MSITAPLTARPMLLALALAACAPGKPISTEPSPKTPLIGDTICLAGVASRAVLTNPSALAAEIARYKDLGVKMIRYDVTWQSIETTQGVYDLDWLDAPLKALEAANIQSIADLDYGNTLYNNKTSDKYPTPPAPFAAFAGAVAARFGTQFLAYEIWNEENAGYRFWLPMEDSIAYAQLLDAAAKSITSACPKCQPIFGGVFWLPEAITGGVPFIQKAYATVPSLATDLAGIGVHPYSYYPPSDAPDDTTPPEVSLVDMMSQAVAATGSNPPTWITEVGWPVFVSGPDEPTQAADLVKTYTLANTTGTHSVCWYDLQDRADYMDFPPEGAFGLLRYDPGGPVVGTPKPAYMALKALSQWLGATGYSRDRKTELGMTMPGDAALFFRDAAGKRGATIVWRSVEQRGDTVRIPLHGSVTAHLIDVSGNVSVLTPDSKNGITVPIDLYPRIIIEDAK